MADYKRYYEEHREELLEKKKAYGKTPHGREVARKANRKYYAAHKDERRETKNRQNREYYERHREEIKQKQAEYRKRKREEKANGSEIDTTANA